ncbi:MAG: carbohydrate kinase family protein [Candidatus Hodarchaeota archaeon]
MIKVKTALGIGKALIMSQALRLLVTVDLVVAGKLAIDELSFEGTPHRPVLGGAAAHVALAAATVGARVAIVSSIGDDFPAEFLAILQSKGIDLTGVVQRRGKSSHFWADFTKDGIMKSYGLHFGVGNRLSFRRFTQLVKNTQAVHLGILPPYQQRRILKRVHGQEKLLSMTTIFHQALRLRDEILPQLPLLDIMFLNAKEASFLTQTTDIHIAIQKLGEFVPLVIVTQGPKGCMVNHQGVIRHIAGYPTNEVDTTGAGDSFAGAFLASYLQNRNIENAAQWGNAAGALNVREVGCNYFQQATRKDLENLMHQSLQ